MNLTQNQTPNQNGNSLTNKVMAAGAAAVLTTITLVSPKAISSESMYPQAASQMEITAKPFTGTHLGLSSYDPEEVVTSFVAARVEKALRPKHRKIARGLASVIGEESKKYGFDPLFLMAVIQNESRWNPYVVGGVGEIGLMQIRPETAEWLAKQMGMKWKGPQMLRDYRVNVRLGAFYLNQLRGQFGTFRHVYLSAYNMGPTAAAKVIAKRKTPIEYKSKVLNFYVNFYMDLKREVRAAKAAQTKTPLTLASGR